MLPTPAATEAVRRSVRTALRAEAGEQVRHAWHADLDEDDFLAAVGRQRVAQLVLDHAEQLGLPDPVRAGLAAAVRHERLQALSLGQAVAALAVRLAEHEVRALMVKGPCLAVQTTGDLAARDAGDIDVLVPPDDVGRVHGLLEAWGWRPPSELPRPDASWGWRHLMHSGYQMPFTADAVDGWPVDLHWQLQPVRHGVPDFDAMWDARATVRLANSPVATLNLADAFGQACSHAAKDGWAVLRSLVDVHRIARREEAWRAPLGRADLLTLAATEATIGLPPGVPAEVLSLLRTGSSAPGRAARRAQDRPLVDPGRFPLVNVVDTFRRNIRTSRAPDDLARLLLGQALPPKDFGSLNDRTAVTAVPRAVARQGRRLPVRIEQWRRARG